MEMQIKCRWCKKQTVKTGDAEKCGCSVYECPKCELSYAIHTHPIPKQTGAR